MGALAFAQAQTSQPSQESLRGSEASPADNSRIEKHEFTGCLAKAALDYIVVAEDGQTYKLNSPDPTQLDQYVGKRLR